MDCGTDCLERNPCSSVTLETMFTKYSNVVSDTRSVYILQLEMREMRKSFSVYGASRRAFNRVAARQRRSVLRFLVLPTLVTVGFVGWFLYWLGLS